MPVKRFTEQDFHDFQIKIDDKDKYVVLKKFVYLLRGKFEKIIRIISEDDENAYSELARMYVIIAKAREEFLKKFNVAKKIPKEKLDELKKKLATLRTTRMNGGYIEYKKRMIKLLSDKIAQYISPDYVEKMNDRDMYVFVRGIYDIFVEIYEYMKLVKERTPRRSPPRASPPRSPRSPRASPRRSPRASTTVLQKRSTRSPPRGESVAASMRRSPTECSRGTVTSVSSSCLPAGITKLLKSFRLSKK